MKEKKLPQKNKSLDVLRGIGILGIVLYHAFPTLFPGGFLGVPLFFVLSGYLMFASSDTQWKQGKFRIRSYYKKRMTRILPSLFIMVMGVCCYLTLFYPEQLIGIRQEICSIFLGYDNWWQIGQHSSYFSSFSNSPFTHLWFLAVEIQFYLLWPILFLTYQKGSQIIGGKKMCFFFAILALLSAGRMFYLYIPGSDPSRVYYGTDTMAFPLLIGMFLGALRSQYESLRFSVSRQTIYAVFLCFLLNLCALFLLIHGQNDGLYQGGLFLISLFFAGVINLLENQEVTVTEQADTSLLYLLGQKSYQIYLWHYPVVTLALFAL
ncbi:MAG: acyltransferase [Lachnospiraceae bacterium]|nr:acyltransferase [Lachnospiraceae bacterium]